MLLSFNTVLMFYLFYPAFRRNLSMLRILSIFRNLYILTYLNKRYLLREADNRVNKIKL